MEQEKIQSKTLWSGTIPVVDGAKWSLDPFVGSTESGDHKMSSWHRLRVVLAWQNSLVVEICRGRDAHWVEAWTNLTEEERYLIPFALEEAVRELHGNLNRKGKGGPKKKESIAENIKFSLEEKLPVSQESSTGL